MPNFENMPAADNPTEKSVENLVEKSREQEAAERRKRMEELDMRIANYLVSWSRQEQQVFDQLGIEYAKTPQDHAKIAELEGQYAKCEALISELSKSVEKAGEDVRELEEELKKFRSPDESTPPIEMP